MALDADDLAAIREHVGSTPDDAALETQWTRLGTVEKVALSVLRTRLADLVAAGPADLRVDGDFAENHAANIAALQRQIAGLVALIPDGDGAVTVSKLTRAGRSR